MTDLFADEPTKPLPPRRTRPKPSITVSLTNGASSQVSSGPVHNQPAMPRDLGPFVHKSPPMVHRDDPIASFACPCGFRDEVKHPAPLAVDCPECRRNGTCVRLVPRYPPPRIAGRTATAMEIASIRTGGD